LVLVVQQHRHRRRRRDGSVSVDDVVLHGVAGRPRLDGTERDDDRPVELDRGLVVDVDVTDGRVGLCQRRLEYLPEEVGFRLFEVGDVAGVVEVAPGV
jgi:hypothetical protein